MRAPPALLLLLDHGGLVILGFLSSLGLVVLPKKRGGKHKSMQSISALQSWHGSGG